MGDDFRIYDIERVWMVRRALEQMDALAPVRNVLDCACNIGYWMEVARRGLPSAAHVGIDNDPVVIARAKAAFPDFELHAGDCRALLPAWNRKFDAVLCMGLLYYYRDI